ncbi:MAG TPA: FHA domain-containing protein [Polyangiaceae bacterium]
MPVRPLVQGLSPPELLETAMTGTLTSFLVLYGDAPLLLVRLDPADAELAIGLGASSASGAGAEPMQFKTVVQSRDETPVRRPGARALDPAAITHLLERAHHFALPLQKREQAGGMSSDRISVGRARNKDFSLRQVSVSKFHAWFEIDPEGGFTLTDAGSKNLTRVNGEVLVPREAKRIEEGDRIRFGTVECFLCSPETLWSALRGKTARSG